MIQEILYLMEIILFFFGKYEDIRDPGQMISNYDFIYLYRNKEIEIVYSEETCYNFGEINYDDDFNCFIFLKKYLMVQLTYNFKIYQITEKGIELISNYSIDANPYKIIQNKIHLLIMFYEGDYLIISEIDKNYKLKERARFKENIHPYENFLFYEQRIYYSTKKDFYVFD